jgi:hypothetical protein
VEFLFHVEDYITSSREGRRERGIVKREEGIGVRGREVKICRPQRDRLPAAIT